MSCILLLKISFKSQPGDPLLWVEVLNLTCIHQNSYETHPSVKNPSEPCCLPLSWNFTVLTQNLQSHTKTPFNSFLFSRVFLLTLINDFISFPLCCSFPAWYNFYVRTPPPLTVNLVVLLKNDVISRVIRCQVIKLGYHHWIHHVVCHSWGEKLSNCVVRHLFVE